MMMQEVMWVGQIRVRARHGLGAGYVDISNDQVWAVSVGGVSKGEWNLAPNS
jgi:hypothetical protein